MLGMEAREGPVSPTPKRSSTPFFILQMKKLSPVDGGEYHQTHRPTYWHSTEENLFFHTSALNYTLSEWMVLIGPPGT